jgi:hypothetical protein
MVAFEEVEDALSEQVGDDADMASIIETISEMNTSVSIFGVICFECRQYSQLYPRRITILLHRTNNLDGYQTTFLFVSCLHDLAKCSLT